MKELISNEEIRRIEKERENILAEIELLKGLEKDTTLAKKSSIRSRETIGVSSDAVEKAEKLARNIGKKIDKKSSNKGTGSSLGIMGRRDFIGVAGLTIAAAGLTKIIEKDEKVEKENQEYKDVKIPRFIFEKSTKGQEKYVTEETLKLINQASGILKTKPVGFEMDPDKPDKLKSSNVVLAMIDITDPSKGIETLEVKPNKKDGENDEGYQITIGENVGMATSFDVTVPEGRVVLAIKRKIQRSNTKIIEDAIYSPYTPDLDIPLVRQKGFEYMVNLSKDAKTELKEIKVKSRFGENSEIAPGVPLEIMVMLSLVEQTDPGVFARNAKKIFEKYDLAGLTAEQIQALQKKADVQALVPMIKRGLTVVSQNGEDTKKYAVSEDGASGLLQLIPSTYSSLEQKVPKEVEKDGKIEIIQPIYKNNKLKPNFIEGAVEHKNAARAAWLLLDSSLYEARNETFFTRLQEDEDFRYKYLSACYNAGSRPVRKTIRENPNDWESKLPDNETVRYVRIFTAMQTLFKEDVEDVQTPANEKPSIFSRIYNYFYDSKEEPPKTREIKVPKSKKNDKELPDINEANDLPPELRGGGTSLSKQLNTAEKLGIKFISDMDQLNELTQHKLSPDKRQNPKLVPLPEKDNLIVINPIELSAVDRRYCTRETAQFLNEMSQASQKYAKENNLIFEPLMINSGVRPDDVQQAMRDPKSPTYNKNATKKSPHSYAATIDIAWGPNKAGYGGMKQAQMDWTQDYLIKKEKEGKIEATQEIGQTVFHIMVFKN